MLVPLTTAVMVAVAALGLVALIYLALDRPVDDGLLLVAALVELGLLVLAVTTAVVHGRVTGTGEGATMLAYALTLPIIPPVVVFIALKEKTRWAMGVVIAGAFTVGVMTYRILQIWQTSGPA
ncbi:MULTISPECIES: hypothetical protein [Janibacter]|uniref:Integral membrane protein n=2 Tax=Janibacter hoylei PVAS-1 TaxID=1210046 RepID=A0A444B9I2_9MICO|nr:hypothetical protein [Janibacter hoylei]MCT1618635.1 hypothetical protein [Janibacter hoylei]MCT2291888.1 hypothetical protein [Janibacter hoylei]MCW4602836.1 hypothetical protein [Janibacter hoylei]RWU85090.1 hypothetical protein CWN80_02775 [Janibacter hoylei PVAS-1]